MSPPRAPSFVHLLGPLLVVDADGVELGPVPAGRASVLVQRLVGATGATVDLDALVDALWGDEAPPTAGRTIASLVSRVRRAVGPGLIVGSPRFGYRFNVGPSWTSDLALLEQFAHEAQIRVATSPSLALTAARRGVALLDRGRPEIPLPFADHPWAEDVVRHVDALRRRLSRALWAAESRLGLWLDVVDQTEAALTTITHDEHAARALMEAHWRLGDRGSALRAHDQLRSHLLAELGVEPSAETEDLYSAIARGDDPMMVTKAAQFDVPDAVRLAGRDRELTLLLNAWSTAAVGQVGAIMVTGPPGSGCTRLAQELSEFVRRTGGRVLRADCFEGERSSALQPLVTVMSQIVASTPPERLGDLVGMWAGTAVELVPELHQAITVAEYQRASPDTEHRRVLNTLRHVLRCAAGQQPTLLFFDDLHLAGSATIDALQWLLHELDRVPLLIITTTQTDRLDADLRALGSLGTVVELGPIREHDVAALAAAEGFGHEASFIWELTQGQLLFVVEVIDSLRRGEARDTIPGTLRSVVLDSVRRRGPQVEELLQIAATIGSAFDIETLEQLAGRSATDLEPLLHTALAAGLLESRNDLFMFATPIVRDALYESTIGALRTLRHRRLASIFRDRPELRAHHERAAGLADEAARSWYEAATLARRSFANADAVRLFSTAFDAAVQSGNVELQGLALTGRGTAREELAEYDLATDDHLRAESLSLATGDRTLRATAVERLGWTAYYRRDVEEAVTRATQASQMPGARPSAWALLGRTKHWAGDFDAANHAYTRALDEVGDDDAVRASVLSCLGALLAHADRYERATEVLDDAVQLCHQIGAFRPLLRALFFAGLARANNGDLSGALTALETKMAILERYDVPFYRARTNTCLAWVWRELGEAERSRDLSELALEQSRKVEDGALQIEQELHALCSLADCDRLDGRYDDAAERVHAAKALAEAWLPFRWRAALRIMEVGSRLHIEDPERLLVDARRAGSMKYESLALHLLGRTHEAADIAGRTGSLLLLAEVGPPETAGDASTLLLRKLPRRLRDNFVRGGRLALDGR